MDDKEIAAIVGQLGVEGVPNVSLFSDDERFDPMPGVYRASYCGPLGPIFICYGRATDYEGRDRVVAVVLQIDDYAPPSEDRGAWAPGVDRRTRFVTKEKWNEMAMSWIGPMSEGLRELGWA